MTTTSNSTFDKATDAFDVAAAYSDAIKGRTILITGVNPKGIGFGTAEAFASQTPRCLILAGRSEAKINEAIENIHSTHPKIIIHPLIVNLSSQSSVRKAAKEVMAWEDVPEIDIVVNNAGVMRHGESFDGPIPQSDDGIEEMFAVNYLSHQLLTDLIMPKIIASAKKSKSGTTRIINLSSSGTWVSPFRASDISWKVPNSELPDDERPNFPMMKMAGLNVAEETSYAPTVAYGQSKTCMILLSVMLNQKLFKEYGILSLAVNPGEVRTELARHTDPEWLKQAIAKREAMGIHFWKNTRQGASTTLVAACDPKLTLPAEDGTGYYLSDCQIAKAPDYATDSKAADKLSQASRKLII